MTTDSPIEALDAAMQAIMANRSNLMIMHKRSTDILEDIKVGLDAYIKYLGDASDRKHEDATLTALTTSLAISPYTHFGGMPDLVHSGIGNGMVEKPVPAAQPCEIRVNGINEKALDQAEQAYEDYVGETAFGHAVKVVIAAYNAALPTELVSSVQNKYLINVKQPCQFGHVMAQVTTKGDANIIEVEVKA